MNEKDKKSLISKLESIIGNSFYNGKIKNWGPNTRDTVMVENFDILLLF